MKKKEKIKQLELQVDILRALLAEYVIKEAIRKIPIPDYAKGSKENLALITDEKEPIPVNKSKFQQRLDEVMEQQKQAKEQ